MPKILIPKQFIELQPVGGQDGRWMGYLKVGGASWRSDAILQPVSLRVEAYAMDGEHDAVQQIVNSLAEAGGALQEVEIEGRQCLLTIMPRGA